MVLKSTTQPLLWSPYSGFPIIKESTDSLTTDKLADKAAQEMRLTPSALLTLLSCKDIQSYTSKKRELSEWALLMHSYQIIKPNWIMFKPLPNVQVIALQFEQRH